MTDNLFIFLTLNVISKDNDIDDYVNVNDKQIYLVKAKDNDLYFVISGIFVLDADNEIRYDKTDSCLFVRNAKTNKVKAINSHELKLCIDTVSIDDYCDELKELYFEYLNTQRAKKEGISSFTRIIEDFKKECDKAQKLLSTLSIKENEDYIEIAKRYAQHMDDIFKYQQLYEIKRYIERLWIKVLYNKDIQSKVENYIVKILKRLMSC